MTVERLYVPFRPRFVRIVGLGVLALAVAGLAVLLWAAPGAPGAGYTRGTVVGMVGFVVLAGIVLWRLATVRADVDTAGITVRNPVRVQTFEWPQVLGVVFGVHDPWVVLELADGSTCAVMAVQRADGVRASREAERLATLVAVHGEGREPAR